MTDNHHTPKPPQRDAPGKASRQGRRLGRGLLLGLLGLFAFIIIVAVLQGTSGFGGTG